MSTTRRWRVTRSVVVLVSAALLLAMLGYPEAKGAPRTPSLRLMYSDALVTVERPTGEPAYLDLGMYVASVGGALELQVRRSGKTFHVDQMRRTASGATVIRRLPAGLVTQDSGGLIDFFDVTVRDLTGEVAGRARAPFCPSGWSQARISDTGPDLTTYPNESGCWFGEISRALVWGIDPGWAVQAPDGYNSTIDLPDGEYRVTMQIAKRYRDLFSIPAADARATIAMTVTSFDWEEPDPEDPWAPEPLDARTAGTPSERRDPRLHLHGGGGNPNASPQVQEGASGLPDLIALPAFSIHVEPQEGRDTLVFGANVWNAGPGPLVVEGFRTPGEPMMDAYQYFYDGGIKTGRTLVGTLEYDDRDGHDHWHFTDFARYQLLTAGGERVVRSGKEAFCLAPTDAIDLTIPTANWRPSWTGLHTSCGGPRSLWIREILDVGWGDTYHQWLPGQSFDITDVPNGTYLIEVVTNPDGRLSERSRANNRAVKKVVLGGSSGARTVRAG